MKFALKCISCCLLLLPCLLVSVPAHATFDMSALIQRAPILNPNETPFPDSSLLDRTAELDAPAGKHGFLRQKDGHFYFVDGTRARFFGINLAKTSVFIDKRDIDTLAEVFARAGINLVRLHHLDDAIGILDPMHPNAFNTQNLDLVDYWVAKLKERGIYLCLDLNDYRTYHASEGVPFGDALGRGAKPYAVFDQRLIEMQEEYARRLLVEHINPYTKLAYTADPAVALLEIYDENGLFIRRDDWQKLQEPYLTALRQQWNAWLRFRYRTTAALKSAWTDGANRCALATGESLEQASVKLPVMALSDAPPRDADDPLRAPARVTDGAQFAYDSQLNYLQVMMNYLHEIGVTVPITAVGAQEILPDLMATAAGCDYIGINYYWDHPAFLAGNDWKEPFFCHLSNPLVDNQLYTFPCYASLSHMAGKPLVIRELNYCFPNPYRGVGMLESAAYGALLDIDALFLFTYDTDQANRTIGFFDIRLDPLRWGQVAQASRLFLSGEVKTAPHTVGIGYSPVDAFSWRTYLSPLYQLAFNTGVVNYTTPATPHPFDLLITSGRSCAGGWKDGHILFFSNRRQTDLHNQIQGDGLESGLGYHLKTQKTSTQDFVFQGMGYAKDQKVALAPWSTFGLADLQAQQFQPLGITNTGALGFYDAQKKVIGFHNLPEDAVVRFALDALHDWSQAPTSHAAIEQSHYRSDTGQLDRDITARLLRIDTPSIQCLAGKLNSADGISTSAVTLRTTTGTGTLTVESLDHLPLEQSTAYLVKMTSRAFNTGVSIQPASDGPCGYKIISAGHAPICTNGIPATTPSHVELNSKVVLDIYLQDGTWEYLASPDRALLYLDTPNITVKLSRQPTRVRFHLKNSVQENTSTGNTIQIPAGVRFTEIVW